MKQWINELWCKLSNTHLMKRTNEVERSYPVEGDKYSVDVVSSYDETCSRCGISESKQYRTRMIAFPSEIFDAFDDATREIHNTKED